MSRIIACYKWVVDEADIKVNPDLSIDTKKAKGKISEYDKSAIEAAVQTAALLGGKPVGLTFGSKAQPSLKDALSRGLEEAFWLNAPESETADGAATARALAAAVKNLDDVSLIICAEGASDTYARQTAPRIGALLDLPVVTSVVKIQAQDGGLLLQRKLDDCLETVTVSLPAVIALLPESYSPPIPGLKAVMAAGKKPVTEYKSGDIQVDYSPRSTVKSVKGYVMNRKNILITEGDSASKVRDLVSALRKEGVL